MIYTLFGTDSLLRKKGFEKFLGKNTPSFFLRKENLYQLPALIDAEDMFGGKIIVVLDQFGVDADGRDIIKKYAKGMGESKNLFIIDEPFADANFVKTLQKIASEHIDAREEKKKEADPFSFVNVFALRDKKRAWLEWMKIRDQEGEAVHGALWWKVKILWQGAKEGRRSAFNEEDLACIGYKLVTMSHEAHRGNVDLKEEIEKLTLSL